jgi:lysophospholipase L1-like esterase
MQLLKGLLPLFLFSVSLVDSECLLPDPLPERLCDGKVVFTVLGDSFVYGIGEAIPGGYVRRVSTRFPDIQFNNLGIPGDSAKELYRKIRKAFRNRELTDSPLASTLLFSDYVLLDTGRNDRWDFVEVSVTYNYLKRSASFIQSQVEKGSGEKPLVIIANLMLPNRGSQGPWVKELNSLILRGSTLEQPANLRFDLVSKRLLNLDQLHPRSKGYDALARTLTIYLRKTLPEMLGGAPLS